MTRQLMGLSIVLMIVATGQTSAQTTSPKLVYSTYLGEGPNIEFHALAVDSAGFAYIAGNGRAPDGVSNCSFISQLDQFGSKLVWNVCLPFAEVNGLVMDGAGYIYLIARDTPSSQSSTVMKLAPVTHEIVYSTAVQGLNGRIALDSAGNVYVFGLAGAAFQSTPEAYSSSPSDLGFVEKLDASGQAVVYATRLAFDAIGSIAVDSQGQAWAVGSICPQANCGRHGYVRAIRKLDAAGSHLLVSQTYGYLFSLDIRQYVGDTANAVAVDGATDAVWIVGGDLTGSVPITPNAIEPTRPNVTIARYAVKLSASGELLYGSYVGARSQDPIASVALDSSGQPFFSSVSTGRLTTIYELSADGSSIVASKAFGSGIGTLALDGRGGIYLAGMPGSSRLCPTTPGSYKPGTGPGNTIICTARFDLLQLSDSQVFVPVSAASGQGGSLVPGELLTIHGVNLPPLTDAHVSFDGVPAPVLDSGANGITAVVPFGINSATASFVLQDVGGFTLGVSPSVPALFTGDATGNGQLTANNADGSPNGVDSPAAPGDVVTVLMTGAGLMDPPIDDGALGPVNPPFPVPVIPVFVAVNGVAANVVSVVQAPGKIAGIVQVSFQVPPETASGDAVVKISSDPASFPFQSPTTIAVR